MPAAATLGASRNGRLRYFGHSSTVLRHLRVAPEPLFDTEDSRSKPVLELLWILIFRNNASELDRAHPCRE